MYWFKGPYCNEKISTLLSNDIGFGRGLRKFEDDIRLKLKQRIPIL